MRNINCKKYLTGSDVILCCGALGACSTLLFSELIDLSWLVPIFLLLVLCARRWHCLWGVAAMLLGVIWATALFYTHFNSELPAEYEGQNIKIEGRVIELPNADSRRTRFRFYIEQAVSIGGTNISQLQDQKVQLNCYYCPVEFLPDQHWRLTVRLKRPHGYASWGAFDYEKYLFRHQLIATGYVRSNIKRGETLELLSSTSVWTNFSLNQWRFNIRQSLQEAVKGHQVGRAVLAALLIGDKSELSNQNKDVFQHTGVSHLMAISGLHVGLVFFAVAWLFKWLLMPFARVFDFIARQRLVLIPAFLSAIFYAGLAGFAVSTQRAIIMLAVFSLARLGARDVSLFKVLLIAVSIILIVDPFSILDVGFWLSCGAVLVIAIASINVDKLSLLRLQPMLWLGMLPLTLLFFGQVSWVSPLVNLLVVPLFCSLLIPLALLSLILMPIGWGQWMMVQLAIAFEWVYDGLDWVSSLPLTQSTLPPMQMIDWIVFILMGGAYVMRWRVRYALLPLFIVALFTNSSGSLKMDEIRIALLDVGQGLSMVVEAHDYVLVYDTGPAFSSGFNATDAVLIPYLRQRNIHYIDRLIISHADNDHIGGFPSLADGFDIGSILTSRTDKISDGIECHAGQHWQVSDITFSIIGPDENTPQGSNNRSCVLRVSNGAVTMLITGDIEKPVERYMLTDNVDVSAHILLVPHQGSKTSSTAAFIDAVKPELALLAAGYRNHYGHPHRSVVERYKSREIELISTIESGSIVLNINNKSWFVTRYRQSNKGFWNRQKTTNF